MIPEEHKSRVIQDGICLIQSITECYGAETGMELWSKIAEVLDPSVKGEIFFAMLTGQVGGKMRVSISAETKLNQYHHYKISMIKVLRTATGMTLKDAKDFVEYLADNPGVRKDISIPDRLQYRVYEQQLKEVGFTV